MISMLRPFGRLFSRTLDAIRNPQRPPILAIEWTDSDAGRMRYSTSVYFAAQIALTEGIPTITFATVAPWHWHRDERKIPSAAWRTWRTIPTGEFLERLQKTGERVGTYHTNGTAALVRQGYSPREAASLVAEYA